MAQQVMRARDAISGAQATCHVTINGERFQFAQCKSLEAKMEKNKTEVPILGSVVTPVKTTGWKGTGTATFYYNTSVFRKVMNQYQTGQEDLYFEIQVINEDKTSSVGQQQTVLKNCNLDSSIIAKFNAGNEVLEEECPFTFEAWEMPVEFNKLSVMNGTQA